MKAYCSKKYPSFYQLSLTFILLCFLVSIALPVTVHYFNKLTQWEPAHWLKVFFVLLAFGLPLLALTKITSNRLAQYIYLILITLASYIIFRTYLLPVQFGVLLGTTKVKLSFFSDISLYSSLLVLTVLFIYSLLSQVIVKNILTGTFVGVLCFVTYAFAKETGNHKITPIEKIENRLRYTSLSKTKNIIILSFDSIQRDMFFAAIEKYPELKKIFDGFTLYSDVSSYAPNTIFSIPSTLTGKELPFGKNGTTHNEVLTRSYKDSLEMHFKKHGYETSLFTSLEFPEGHITNESILPDEVHIKKPFSAYEIATLRILPIYFSQLLWRKKPHHDNNQNLQHNSLVNLINSDTMGLGFGFDLLAFRELYKTPHLIEKPVFKFHHYLFTHTPIRFNKYCQYIINTPQNNADASEEITCAAYEISHYISMLKKHGVYDKTFLIIVSDHGYNEEIQPKMIHDKLHNGWQTNTNGKWLASRYWPILLVKDFNKTGLLEINNLPVSLLDIAPTILEREMKESYNEHDFIGKNFLKKNAIAMNRKRKIIYYNGGIYKENDSYYSTTLFEETEFSGNSDDAISKLFASL